MYKKLMLEQKLQNFKREKMIARFGCSNKKNQVFATK